MNEDQKKEKKIKTGTIKMDWTTIGCLILILFLTLIAVLPPMLRIYLPDLSNSKEESSSKTNLLEEDAVIFCTKSSSDGSITITLNEEFQLKSGRIQIARLREVRNIAEDSNITQDELESICMDTKREVDNLNGVSVSCERENEKSVKKSQEITYDALDYYMASSIAPNFRIEFAPSTRGIDIQKAKQQAGYTCSVNGVSD